MKSNWPENWVFLRGLGREQGHWGNFPQRCARELGWRVHCMDLPGFGDQHSKMSPASITAVSIDLRARCPFPPHQPLGLFGLSLGGMVALQWAVDAPGQVTALVLANSSSTHSGLLQRFKPAAIWPLLRGLGSRSIKSQERQILALVSNRFGNDPAVLAHWVQLRQQSAIRRGNVLRQLLAARNYRAPSPRRLAHLDTALVLASRADRMVSSDCSATLASLYQWPLALHHQAGHDLPLDNGDWIIQQLRRRIS